MTPVRGGTGLAKTVLAFAALASLVGCGPSPESVAVATGAVRAGAAAVGRSADREVVVSVESVSSIARQSGASEETVRSVASNLDQQPVWRQSVDRARSVYEAVPEQVRDPILNIACQGFTGQIRTPEQLAGAIQQEFQGQLTRDQLRALYNSVTGLWQELNRAYASGDNGRAAALLTCFTFDQLTN